MTDGDGRGTAEERHAAVPATRPADQPTVNDVALRAGVSRQTVSNVLNAPERVRPATRERVQQAIRDLGYRPHRTARNLKARSTHLLGYRVPPSRVDSINPVLDRFLHALTDAARTQGYHVLLFTPDESQDEISAHEELLATRTVDGFVLSETNYGDARVRHLAEHDVPFAAFGRSGIEVPHAWVDVDGAAGTAAAVAHLAARGHQRIAYLGWPDGSVTGDQRALGYRRGLGAAGIPPDPELDVRGEEGTAAGHAAAERWLAQPDPPTAVVAASDLLAIGVLQAARARDVRIGVDLAVIGFDDTPVAPFTTPALTSLRQPLERVAVEVVRRLIARINGDTPPADGVLLPPELVVRDSA